MDVGQMANKILMEYGLIPIYTAEEIREEIEAYYRTTNYSHLGFVEHMIDFITYNSEFNGASVDDVNKLRKKIGIQDEWGNVELWFSKFLSVEYETVSKVYAITDNLSYDEVFKKGLKSPYLLKYLEKNKTKEFVEEYKVRCLFEQREAVKMIWTILDRKLSLMQREMEEKGDFYNLKKEIQELFEKVEAVNELKNKKNLL